MNKETLYSAKKYFLKQPGKVVIRSFSDEIAMSVNILQTENDYLAIPYGN